MEIGRAFTGSIPQNYDDYLGPILFEPYAREIAGRIPPGTGSVLELACGTGRVTRHLLDVLPSNAKLVSTDLNPDMLTIARSRLQDDRVEWKVVDAQALPFEDDAFDLVVCQFGVMFFPDRAAACEGIRRVLKPGGRFLFNTWGSLATNPYADLVVSTMRQMANEAAINFLERIPHSYYDKNEIYRLLEQAGFRDIVVEDVSIEGSYENAMDLATGYIDGSPTAMFLNDYPEKKLEAKKLLAKVLGERYGDHNGKIPMHAIVAQASK